MDEEDESIEQILILDVCHGLLRPAYEMYFESAHGVSKACRAMDADKNACWNSNIDFCRMKIFKVPDIKHFEVEGQNEPVDIDSQ